MSWISLQITLIGCLLLFMNGEDIGCNYVNVGGVAMPMDYCMQTVYETYNIAIKWTCNNTWNGINMEIYGSQNCDNNPFYIQPYTDDVPGFQCLEEYKTSFCNQVSINAYVDDECEGDALSELRLITDECLLYEEDIYVKLLCTENTATLYIYQTFTGECNDEYLRNTTALTEGSLGGQTAGCIAVEGCLSKASFNTKNSAQSQIIGYVIIAVLAVVFVAIIVIFTLRYLHKKKMSSVTAVAAVSVTHSGKSVQNPYGELNSTNELDDENTNVPKQETGNIGLQKVDNLIEDDPQ